MTLLDFAYYREIQKLIINDFYTSSQKMTFFLNHESTFFSDSYFFIII